MTYRNRFLKLASLLFALALFFASGANAQVSAAKKALLDQTAKNMSNLPAQHQHILSSGMQRIMQVSQTLNSTHSKLGGDGGTITINPKVGGTPNGAASSTLAASSSLSLASFVVTPNSGDGPGGTTLVSNPTYDFVNSVMSSFTQSETSSARCGNTVVVGFNDSGAFTRTAGVNPAGAWSFSSASYSHDGGRTFTDIGYLNPGTNPVNFIAGDPVIACTSSSTFYYSSIFASGQDSSGNFFNGVAVNASTDGGVTWSAPTPAVAKDFNHGIDKPWIAADPTNPSRLYVTYTDFDISGFFDPTAPCPFDERIAIEEVSSNDGGNTWTAPVVVHQECYFTSGTFSSVQGSNPAVGPDGSLYVGYEFYPGLLPNNEIHVAKSTNNGQSFASDVKVSNVWPNGDYFGGVLQGGFRNNEFPQVAVDRSKGSSRGTVYVAYSDGANNIVLDLPSFYFANYAYPDVMVAKSTDGGATYSTPAAVSPTPSDFTGRGRDQFFPGIAVDRKGRVGVCYYDRRQNPLNLAIDRYCSVSQDHGSSWDEQRVSHSSWVPAHYSDGVINATYIGDYDALSSDFLLKKSGFFSSFEVQIQGNPDVVGTAVEQED